MAKQLGRDLACRKPDNPAEQNSRAAVMGQMQLRHFSSNPYPQSKDHPALRHEARLGKPQDS